MKKPTIINGIGFETQKAAKDYTRKLLLKLEPIGLIGTTIKEWEYLNALIKRHPEYESKKGVGIGGIIIKRDYNNSIAMDLKRTDGTVIDISWVACVTSKGASEKENLISAMRFAVKKQIDQFRDNAQRSHPPPICGICCNPIPPSHDMHVHHCPRFEELAEAFIKDNCPSPTQFEDDIGTNQAKFTLADNIYSKRWQAYHRAHANLLTTHSKCNLTQSK